MWLLKNLHVPAELHACEQSGTARSALQPYGTSLIYRSNCRAERSR